MPKKDSLEEMMNTLWPERKKELEKIINNTKKTLQKGESYLRKVSEKGAKKAREWSLGLKRESLYYSLGKTAANTAKSKWSSNKKISSLMTQIKKLDTQIKESKKKSTRATDK